MARTVTLTNILARIRKQADIESMTDRHPDADLIPLVNQSIQALRLKLAEAGQPYYLKYSASANTVADQAEYDLPSDFVALYGIDLTFSQRTISLQPFGQLERNDYERYSPFSTGIPSLFRLQAEGKVRLMPTPDQAYAYVLLYLPTGTDLSAGSDTFDGIAGWEDWVIYDTCLRLLTADDDDEMFAKIQVLLEKREREIVSAARKRQRAAPAHRIDTRGRRLRDERAARRRW